MDKIIVNILYGCLAILDYPIELGETPIVHNRLHIGNEKFIHNLIVVYPNVIWDNMINLRKVKP